MEVEVEVVVVCDEVWDQDVSQPSKDQLKTKPKMRYKMN